MWVNFSPSDKLTKLRDQGEGLQVHRQSNMKNSCTEKKPGIRKIYDLGSDHAFFQALFFARDCHLVLGLRVLLIVNWKLPIKN